MIDLSSRRAKLLALTLAAPGCGLVNDPDYTDYDAGTVIDRPRADASDVTRIDRADVVRADGASDGSMDASDATPTACFLTGVQQVFPLSGSVVHARSIELRWKTTDGRMIEGRVRVRTDRNAESAQWTFGVRATDRLRVNFDQGDAGMSFAPGTYYWDIEVDNPMTACRERTATWQFRVLPSFNRLQPAADAGMAPPGVWGTLPDFDGDGLSDLALVVPVSGTDDPGELRVYPGVRALTEWSMSTFSPRRLSVGGMNIPAGRVMATAGDVNGDGFSDLAVARSTGGLYLWHGSGMGLADGETSHNPRPVGHPSVRAVVSVEALRFLSVLSIAPLGDFNGDGYADLALGVRPVTGSSTTEIAIMHGNSDPARITLRRISPLLSDLLRTSDPPVVGGAGDINGDGLGDLVVGDPGPVVANHGRVITVLGQTDDMADYRIFSARGDDRLTGRDDFARGVTTGGDCRGTGLACVLVERRDGAALLSGFTGQSLMPFASVTESPAMFAVESAPARVACLGDLNQDGLTDNFFGLPQNIASTAPSAGLFHGAAADPRDITLDGDEPARRFGYAAAGAGDFDGDQYDDLAVAWLDRQNQSRITVYRGGVASGSPPVNPRSLVSRSAGDVITVVVGAPGEVALGRGR